MCLESVHLGPPFLLQHLVSIIRWLQSCCLYISVSCPLTEKNQVLLFLVLLDSLFFEILQPLSVKGFCSVTFCPLYPTYSLFLYRFFYMDLFFKKIFIEFLAVLFLFYIFTFICNSHGILVSWLGIKPAPPSIGGWNLNHWTSWEVPQQILLKWHAQMSPVIKLLLCRSSFLAVSNCFLLFNTMLFMCISVCAVCTSNPSLSSSGLCSWDSSPVISPMSLLPLYCYVSVLFIPYLIWSLYNSRGNVPHFSLKIFFSLASMTILFQVIFYL